MLRGDLTIYFTVKSDRSFCRNNSAKTVKLTGTTKEAKDVQHLSQHYYNI